MTQQETAAQLCFDAAAYMEEHGLCKSNLGTPDGRVCVRGALNMADHGTPFCDGGGRCWAPDHTSPVVLAADDRLTKRLGFESAAWNNMPERTQDEVVDELRATGRDLLADSSVGDAMFGPLTEGVPVPA